MLSPKPSLSSIDFNSLSINSEDKHSPNKSQFQAATLPRRQRTIARSTITNQEIFEEPVHISKEPSPVTAIFSGTEKKTSKAWLNRNLRSYNSLTSLSISFWKDSATPQPTTPKKSPGVLKFGFSFQDVHSCLETEYYFKNSQPLVLNGRYLTKKGPLLIQEANEFKKIQVFLFSDILVYGYMQNESANLKNQQILNFSDVKVTNDCLEKEDMFKIGYSDQTLCFKAATEEERDIWITVIQSGITFYRCLSERKNKEMSLAQSYKRRSSVVPEIFTLRDKSNHSSSRRQSLYGVLRSWGSSLSRKGSAATSRRGSIVSENTKWIPDNEATVCMICTSTKFSVVIRRHHCRRCGKVICWKCSTNISSGDNKQGIVRVCSLCVENDEGNEISNKEKVCNEVDFENSPGVSVTCSHDSHLDPNHNIDYSLSSSFTSDTMSCSTDH